MKSIIPTSFIGSILLASALVHIPALGQATPGPEHDMLRKMEGTWNAKVILEGSESTGTSTYKMTCGGLWLSSEFRGDLGGMKFEGHGMDTYDAEKKKYVSVWMDSMSTRPMLLEGTYDKAKKAMTMTGEAPGPDGKLAKHKFVTHMPDDDHQTLTLYLVGADGQEAKMMSIEYTRKK